MSRCVHNLPLTVMLRNVMVHCKRYSTSKPVEEVPLLAILATSGLLKDGSLGQD